MKEYTMTKLASCAGCGAKVGAGTLSGLLKGFPTKKDPNLLVGFDTCDDAAVYRISPDLAMVQTVDFFPPVCDDPYLFGQIAAANALSDIYAMGGTPKTALNLLAVPKEMDGDTVRAILAGGYEKVYEADAVIAGGHSIFDPTPKYGLSVTGFVHPGHILANQGAKAGDILFLTKPLGVGILISAAQGNLVPAALLHRLYTQMATLNKAAALAMEGLQVHSCTDVTGFGLLGHLSEMTDDNVTAVLYGDAVPLLDPSVGDFAKMGLIPEGAYRNRSFCHSNIKGEDIPRETWDILYDPQTSGGLLIAVDPADAPRLSARLSQEGMPCNPIGEIVDHREARVEILSTASNNTSTSSC